MSGNKYSYLEDREFLRQFDLEDFKTQYVRISVLDFNTEQVIAYIEGKATGGNVNLNGNSNVRRTMSCSLLVDKDGIYDNRYRHNVNYENITEIENLISMNKKITAEIGFDNTLAVLGHKYYPEFDKIWFPLGMYVIKTASVSKSNSGLNISINTNDKTSLLNGDVGGIIPAATVFSESEIYNADATERQVEKPLIKDIIKHLVIDFGGETPDNVIIEDIPETIRKIMKWTGETNLYYYEIEGSKEFVTEKKDGIEPSQTFTFGQDCGYVAESFYYPGTLECSAGESVAAMLDKIKNALGNYEWFYDIWGRFHFQQKKNYINTSHASEIDNLSDSGYLSTMNLTKTVYTFDESNRKLLTNISNSPQYQNVKNDFIVWGERKTASGVTKPIRYHLAFDSKPVLREDARECIIYTDYKGLQQVIILNNNNRKNGPAPKGTHTDQDKEYYYISNVEGTYYIEHWDEDQQMFRVFSNWEYCYLKTDDWRTELYFLGLENSNKPFAKNYYAAELNAEWPKIYDVKKNENEVLSSENKVKTYDGGYRDNISPDQYEYFLDFIEGNQGGNINLSQFNVNNIGRRTKIGNDKNANCIFSTDVPPILFINADGDTQEDYEKTNSPELNGYDIVQISEEIFNKMVVGGNNNSAYDKIKELLIQHTHYNEAITLNTIPIYYLEPNSRIHIDDAEIGINGDYIINTISLPLTIGTSSISCVKCIENTI